MRVKKKLAQFSPQDFFWVLEDQGNFQKRQVLETNIEKWLFLLQYVFISFCSAAKPCLSTQLRFLEVPNTPMGINPVV